MNAQPPLNPFTQFGTIRDPDKFIGRRAELSRIFDRLRAMQSMSVVGERRIGKSSLLYHVCQTSRQNLGEGYRAVYTDLPDVTDESSFYNRVCQALGAPGSTFSSLEERVRSRRVILCLDEFEKLAGNPVFSRSFFGSLRSLANSGNLALLLATEHSLADLCSNEQIRTSPFWNIFARINIGLFKPDEAEEVVRVGFDGAGIPTSDDEVTRVVEIAGRFPFFLQLACYYLFEMKVGRVVQWEEDFEDSAKDHLHYLWNRLNSKEQSALGWALGLGECLPQDALVTDLEQRGLLVSGVEKQFGWWVFSEAFEVIVRNPPSPPRSKRWWHAFFPWIKGGKVGVSSTGPSAEVQFERPQDKD